MTRRAAKYGETLPKGLVPVQWAYDRYPDLVHCLDASQQGRAEVDLRQFDWPSLPGRHSQSHCATLLFAALGDMETGMAWLEDQDFRVLVRQFPERQQIRVVGAWTGEQFAAAHETNFVSRFVTSKMMRACTVSATFSTDGRFESASVDYHSALN